MGVDREWTELRYAIRYAIEIACMGMGMGMGMGLHGSTPYTAYTGRAEEVRTALGAKQASVPGRGGAVRGGRGRNGEGGSG